MASKPLRVRDTPAAMRPFTSLPPCSGKRPKIAGCGWIFPRGADPGSAKKSYVLQRVVLRIEAEYAFRAFDEFPEQDIRPQPDGSFLIDEEMPINEWLTGYLLSFADGLEVIEPAALRTALKEKIHSMQKKYDKQVSGSQRTVRHTSPKNSKDGGKNGRIRGDQGSEDHP